MNKSTQLKQQALQLKAAFEEGYKTMNRNWQPEHLAEDWDRSTAKIIHDQLLLEARGGMNVHG